jgi:hypothetical protein
MSLTIEYGVDLIVGVIHQDKWRWLIVEIFDVSELLDPESYGADGTKDIEVTEFLKKTEHLCVTASTLSEALLARLPLDDEDDLLEFNPSLLINLDEKSIVNAFSECVMLEKYAPASWQRISDSIVGLVPMTERYWIIEGRDFIKESGQRLMRIQGRELEDMRRYVERKKLADDTSKA